MRFLLLLLGLATAQPSFAASPKKLPALGADPARTSVSGLSSGGFFAMQYAVAYSSGTIGAGIVAGGPYACGLLGLAAALPCMQGKPSGAGAFNAALWYAGFGAIDPTDHIAHQKIYLFHGTQDKIVFQPAMDAVRDFYVDLKVPAANLLYVKEVAAGHAFISDRIGGACDANGDHYINRCDVGGQPYDQPGAILAHLLGPLKPRATTLSSVPIPFDQRPYLPLASAMADTGYVYIPKDCRKAAAHCAVHVVFHGCGQSAAYAGADVYAGLGYNAWADTNGIVILYPQVDKSPVAPFNPQGCWDWWGYTGPALGGFPRFQTQSAPQMRAVHDVVARLQAAR
ncbi:PHB depolymerase family esterase [Sphingomonas sp. AP4-R1]|uniref:extracellular catalytic domain type 2 short-chain-length polyhydroxyalkanoate depolymerase n=1 Tax=Sphingomonas sp. AP4-R1 TaxID=2735134 RepID=UPI001C0FB766|nr:PHB depolymerase family esterase [Sphingomonas sp. AP4-R1]